MTTNPSFDVLGPLPAAPVLLEASAGTGKTWAIAALAVRFVAEVGVRVGELLVVTFSDRAAAELRNRIYARFMEVAEQLEAGSETVPSDPIARWLAANPSPEHLPRLRSAIAEFDRAMITTIHSFTFQTLQQLGVLADWDEGTQTSGEPRSLIDECAADEYVARWSAEGSQRPQWSEALRAARKAAASEMGMVPTDAPLHEYLTAVRDRFEARKRVLGVVTYDDTIARLRAAVTQPVTGPAVTEDLRRRYRVVLVDEFQDTDPDQWAILDAAFVRAGHPTVLIGDPKQSIYGFRSADLLSYLAARERASAVWTLDTNYRSSRTVVGGISELFGNVELGDAAITLSPVKGDKPDVLSAPDAPEARVWLRTVDESTGTNPDHLIDADVVAHIQYLLSRAELPTAEGGRRPVTADDIAILVRTGERGSRLAKVLSDAGIPTSHPVAATLVDSPAGADWMALLRAVAHPEHSNIALAAMTDLIPAPFEAIVDASGGGLHDVSAHVRRLGALLDAHGPAALVAAALEHPDLAARLSRQPDGERRLSDLRHVGGIVAALPPGSAPELLASYRAALTRADGSDEGAPTQRHSDEPAVRVATIHSAKGLQFPIVLLPQVSVTEVRKNAPFPLVVEGSRKLWIGRAWSKDKVVTDALVQARAEELRLLYVGLTRAQHLAVAWHAMGKRAAEGGLTALLARDRARSELLPKYTELRTDLGLDPRLVHVAGLGSVPAPAAVAPPAMQPVPAAVTWTRTIDQTWRRTSYSGLTAGLHDLAAPLLVDEPADLETMPAAVPPVPGPPSPMNGLPSGTVFGTVVHAVLEGLDWAPSTISGDVMRLVRGEAPRLGLEPAQTEQLAAALAGVCSTPLGTLAGGRRLSDIPIARRLAELDFDLPLGSASARGTVGELAELMARHLPDGHALAPYPRHLSSSPAAMTSLNGFLTGSIDVVLELADGGFLVIDYKTNRIPTLPGEDLSTSHYHPAAMASAMMSAHYPLQALLYSAALHRFLSWRLPTYDPSRHLAGVEYLFVRGMAGAQTPLIDGEPCGVFQWRPSVDLIIEASDLLGGHA